MKINFKKLTNKHFSLFIFSFSKFKKISIKKIYQENPEIYCEIHFVKLFVNKITTEKQKLDKKALKLKNFMQKSKKKKNSERVWKRKRESNQLIYGKLSANNIKRCSGPTKIPHKSTALLDKIKIG